MCVKEHLYMNAYVEWIKNKKERGRRIASAPFHARGALIIGDGRDKRNILNDTLGWSSSASYGKILHNLKYYHRLRMAGSQVYDHSRIRELLKSARSTRQENGSLLARLEMAITGDTIIHDPASMYASSIANSIKEFVYFERVEIIITYRGFYKIIREMKNRKAHGIWSYVDTDNIATDTGPSPNDQCSFFMFFSNPQDATLFKLKYGHIAPIRTSGLVQPLDIFNTLYNIST